MKKTNTLHAPLAIATLLLTPADAVHAADVTNLRCEYRENPLGIDVAKPRLSWVLEAGSRKSGDRSQESAGRWLKQVAYQVLVATSEELLKNDQGDLWDSGKVESDQSIQVEYQGKPLESRMRCHWKVRVWTTDSRIRIQESEVRRDPECSGWSSPALWTMGLLKPEDPASPGYAAAGWQAQWIGHDAAYQITPEVAADDRLLNLYGLRWVQVAGGKDGSKSCFRRRIKLPEGRKVRRAVLVLYAYNFCEAAVNGVPVGQGMHWDRTARLDVTKALRSGANAVSLVASHTDPYNPAVIGKLVVQFEAGEDLVIPLDATWKASQEAAAGWESSAFDDAVWAAAEVMDGTPWRGPGAVADLARLPAPYLRKDFSVAKPVKRATVYVTALGVYELHLNGKLVSDDVLAPGWTEFRKRVHYQTYDVTAQIRTGDNTLGAILGDGWYASTLAHLGRRNVYDGLPRFLAQLVVELADGSMQVVASDGRWKAAFGPIRHADLLMGCELDTRLAMPGWDAPGFDAHGWVPVTVGNSERMGVADVTQPLQAAIKDGRLVFTIANEALGGDPVPGVVKSLDLVYRLGDGPWQTRRFLENAVIDLGRPKKPLSIQKATYGSVDSAGGAAMRLQASLVEPSRRIQELKAVKVAEPRPGCWTFDLGQNMVGWVRLKVRGPAGRRITVRHGEMLNADGTIYTASLRSCQATDFYILSGKGEEVLEPYFTFHGFRYVEVRGLDANPGLDAVTGIVVHTPMRRTGSFECSSAPLNQLYSNIIWGQKGNYLEVPTDCPQRDERMGWTGDTQFFAPTAAYNFDVAAFFSRWLQTCEDNQYDDGTFPHVVPDIMGGSGSTAWGDAALICTYNIYRAYGDTRIVADRFAALERYMQWLSTKTKDGISSVGGFGDWLNAGGGAKREAIDTAYHAYLAQIMSEMAGAIGRNDDAARYARLHDEVKAAFVREFLQEDGSLKESSQTGYALAFSMNLLPADRRGKAAARFVEEIQRFDWHLATGFIGTPRLLPALNAAGRNDVACRLLLTDTYPSWLFPVKNGATTMWERWNGWTPEGFGDIGMNSYNHYAFGAVGEYLYGGIGGIQAASPGYKTIVIRPVIGEGLTWAKTSFESMYGTIACYWKREAGRLTLEVTIPPNTTATVYVPALSAVEGPAKEESGVTESGQPASKAAGPALSNVEGVKFLRLENGAAVYEVGSGSYRFCSSEQKEEHSAINSSNQVHAAVTAEQMQQVYDEVKTPFKYGVVIRGEENQLLDSPSVFRKDGQWYMVYITSIRNVGYETCLARSPDLLHWEKMGNILSFPKEGWDRWQRAGYLALNDTTWGGSNELQSYDGKYWMSYLGGALQGYETDPLAIGLAWTKTPTEAREWTALAENPVLHRDQPDVRPFEKVTLYKSNIIWDKARTLGAPFVMFYNGKIKSAYEQIGMAVSDDMVHWKRYGADSVVANGEDKQKGITGDPQVVKIGDLWVMFYFGAFWRPGAFDTFACSADLVHWTKWTGPDLIQPSEPWDKQYAHKPWVVKHDGVVYHFYCAVGDQGRVIALATSKDLKAGTKP